MHTPNIVSEDTSTYQVYFSLTVKTLTHTRGQFRKRRAIDLRVPV